MNPKYVVINYTHIGEVMYIFPASITHAAFANHNAPKRDIISAGFIGLRDNELLCFGESVSLGLSSRLEDKELLNTMFGRAV